MTKIQPSGKPKIDAMRKAVRELAAQLRRRKHDTK